MKRVLTLGSVALIALIIGYVYLFYAPRPKLSKEHLVTRSFDIGVHERKVRFYVPPTAEAGSPLLLALHHSRSRGSKFRRMVGGALEQLAREQGIVVAYPDGYGGHFNDCRKEASYSARTANIDDLGFLGAIVDEAATEYGIDRTRVFALGHSNGGHMAMRLALEAPELLSGMIISSANMPSAENFDCKVEPSLISSVVLIAGTEDPINPYDGGKVTLFGFGNRGNVLSAEASAEWYAQQLGLETDGERHSGEEGDGLSVAWQDWHSLSSRLRLVTIEGGGHAVPQAGYRFGRIFGPTLRSDQVLRDSWEFLQGP